MHVLGRACQGGGVLQGQPKGELERQRRLARCRAHLQQQLRILGG